MKTFPLKFTDEQHAQLNKDWKLALADSKHQYCIDRIFEKTITFPGLHGYKETIKEPPTPECNAKSFCGKCDRCIEATKRGAEAMGVGKPKPKTVNKSKKDVIYGITKEQSVGKKPKK